MQVEMRINNSADGDSRFVTWAPAPCRIRVTNPSGTTEPSVEVEITAQSTSGGGEVELSSAAGGPFSGSVTVGVSTGGASTPFFVRGKFGRPSANRDDVTLEARENGTLVGSVDVMVRIRKNANTLSNDERDRVVSALAQLNNQGVGRFVDFRDMHVSESLAQAHGAPAFLPWHRAYVLDLERELQAIDPSIALPYWRFDQPAPNIFTRDFFGESDSLGTVQFSSGNPLQFWRTDGIPGITRRPFFDTGDAPPGLRSEAQTLALGSHYRMFRTMEGNPHGSAHVSFGGFISNAATAPRDPLFFLLHCNVDRLWAKWQRQLGRFDPALASSFDSNPGNRIGHNLPDTMWPWNGVTGGSRPPTAPGGEMSASACVTAPGAQPRVQDCLDFHGSIAAVSCMGFDYDDVPFA